MKNKQLISFILPAYHAQSFIYNNLNLFSKYCTEADFKSEIIVVNDGSTDKTNEAIQSFLKDKKNGTLIKYINLPENRGKGFAIKKGFELSEGQYIVFTDCDLPYSFKNIDDVVKKLVNKEANVVIACRMHRNSVYKIRSENLSYIYIRHTSGRIYNWLINFFTRVNIEDTQAGLKGFDRETAELVFSKLSIDGFSFDIELLVCSKENEKKISSVPIEFNYESEMSTISFVKQTFFMTSGLMKVFFKRMSGYYKK
ncbi:MAG: glycosyltransferase [Nitrospirae bacterium]|nr:glycosyltransferase [Nitrospirota bacterium]